MATKYYLAIADRLPQEANWSITFPHFSGVTSVAETFADVMRQAKDAIASAVEDVENDNEPLPPSVEEGALPDYDHSPYHDPRALLVPVEPPAERCGSTSAWMKACSPASMTSPNALV